MKYKNKGIINMRKILFTALCALFVSVTGVHAQSADSNQRKIWMQSMLLICLNQEQRHPISS